MLPRLNHRFVFASALSLLLLAGSALGGIFYKTYSSEQWVRHTYAVELLLSDILADINKTGRDRQTFLASNSQQVLDEIERAHAVIDAQLAQLKAMVHDNADQEKACEKLEQIVAGRFATFEQSVELLRSGKSTHEQQDAYTQSLVQWSRQISDIVRDMQAVEARLLNTRSVNTQSVFLWAIVIAVFSYVVSLYVLWEHYRGLTHELQQRRIAEQNALRLSGQLLIAQDQERRKIARDLHDGLGQLLAGAKMAADWLLKRPEDKQKLLELSELLGEAASSTRSISHLLHPPLVDELGFVSAARSYLQGFSKRTGIDVKVDLPELEERLPRDLELALFRILQEALTNIQRHTKSTTAEVQFHVEQRRVALKVRDFGAGLPAGFAQDNGSNLGVGLAGMKERVREHNGQFEIRSDSTGTAILAAFPVSLQSAPCEASTSLSNPSNG